ncbi:hypothetical protein M9458_048158, partial [Cirrhinus mrigala]
WATVDYRRCLRQSLTYLNKMPSGIPTPHAVHHALHLQYCSNGLHMAARNHLGILGGDQFLHFKSF